MKGSPSWSIVHVQSISGEISAYLVHLWQNHHIQDVFGPSRSCVELLLAEKGSPLWAKPVLRRLVPLINTATLP